MMVVYFFDCNNNDKIFLDDIGSELSDDNEALRDALSSVFSVASDITPVEERLIKVDVRTADGRQVYHAVLTFKGDLLGNSADAAALTGATRRRP